MSDPIRLNRIRWRARRGMLELDIILQRYLEQHLPGLDDEVLELLERFLDSADPDLYAWLMGYAVPADPSLFPMVERIRNDGSY